MFLVDIKSDWDFWSLYETYTILILPVLLIVNAKSKNLPKYHPGLIFPTLNQDNRLPLMLFVDDSYKKTAVW